MKDYAHMTSKIAVIFNNKCFLISLFDFFCPYFEFIFKKLKFFFCFPKVRKESNLGIQLQKYWINISILLEIRSSKIFFLHLLQALLL